MGGGTNVGDSMVVMSSGESWASSPQARAVMRGNRRRDTAPEMAIRRACHGLGLRYKVDARPLPGLNRRADLVFSGTRVAVFVDGCYWHGCPDHGTAAKTHTEYWLPKIERNRERDVDTNERLVEAGWVPVRIWEHEDVAAAAQLVFDVVNDRLRALQRVQGGPRR